MIKKTFRLLLFFLVLSCNNIELVLEDNSLPKQLKDQVTIIFNENEEEIFTRELYLVFGNNNNGNFILITSFSEKKENRIVKKNQVAEKIDYELSANYELFYKNRECKIFDKKIVSKFSFLPKSFGYNFGADRSYEKLYANSIKKNVQNFVNLIPNSIACYQ